jgi:hypothetical protein
MSYMAVPGERGHSLALSQALEVFAQAEGMDLGGGEALTLPEVPSVPKPDLHAGAPDRLWWNMGMDSTMRSKLRGEAFFASGVEPAHIRLNMLTEHTLRQLKELNEENLTQDLHCFEDYFTRSHEHLFTNFVFGMTLGIEAYQIESQTNLLPGWNELSGQGTIRGHFTDTVPDKEWYAQSPIWRMVQRKTPPKHFAGLYDDIRLIARYANKEPMQVGNGAYFAADILSTHWETVIAGELPTYVPSDYADPDRGVPGMR